MRTALFLLVGCLAWVSPVAGGPPDHYADGRGNELLLHHDPDVPYGRLRVPMVRETVLFHGDLEGADDRFWFLQEDPSDRNRDPDSAPPYRVVTAVIDPNRTGAEVSIRSFGLPLPVPDAGGRYRRIDAAERLRLARQEHAGAEEALHAVRERVRMLDSAQVGTILAGAETWDKERLAIARTVAQAVDDRRAAEEVPDYWQTLAELARRRALFLRAVSGLERKAGHGGIFIDANGGTLELEPEAAGGDAPRRLVFGILVVLGAGQLPSSVEGVAIFEEPDLAVFAGPGEPSFAGDGPARIELRFREDGHRVDVKALGTFTDHRGGAPFDGVYYRIPD